MRVAVLLATLLVGIASVHANPTSQSKADALFAEGRKLIEAHDDIGACNKFNEAIKIDPDAAGTMLNLGLCNQNLKKYRLALRWFRKAQNRAHETNLPEYELAAGNRTKDLVDLVATIKIEISATTPPDARVRLDGEEIYAADFLHVELDGGHHVLDAGAAGHKPEHQEFDVIGKGGQTITVDLVAGDNSIIVDLGASRRRNAVFTASVGGALLVGALVISVIARVHYGHCVNNGTLTPGQHVCPGTIDAPDPARTYANDQQHLARYWGTSLFAVGAAAVGVATYMYLTAPQRERINQTVWVPTLAPDSVGLAAIGHF
ncbi:hypothetical protein BH11MYX1_BH11MYX1_29240 [soil metagenome]